jgi:integrase
MADGMKLIKNKRTGNYCIRFTRTEAPPHGKLVSFKSIVGRSIKTEKEAIVIFNKLKKARFDAKIAELEGKTNMTLSGLAEAFVSDPDRLHLSSDTHRMDRLALKRLADIIGNKPISRLTREDFKRFKATMLEAEGLTPRTVNSYRQHIILALGWARDEKYIERIPKFKKIKVGKRLVRPMTQEQINNILAYAKEHDFEMWRIIQFALWSGARRSDFHGLYWQEFDGIDEIRVIGKGDKERILLLTDGALKAMGDRKDIGLVFKKFHKDTISRRFRKIADACGSSAIFHDLRRTCATFLDRSGVSLARIQEILGHADIKTTQIYLETSRKMAKEELKKLRFED